MSRRLSRFLPLRGAAPGPGLRDGPERVVFPAEGETEAPPVRIFLGTEPAQWRAERVFLASVAEHRDRARRYEVFRMEALRGFDRRDWTTGFTNYRFAIPSFAGAAGRAIYNDVDQLYLCDPAELFDRDLEGHGFLALSDRETSVMLLDCARMADVWSLDDASRLPKKELVARAAAVAGLRGPLPPEWNARDAELLNGGARVVHYTTLHTQPWRPFPERFAYREGPGADLWKERERRADDAGFEAFSAEQPSEAMGHLRGRPSLPAAPAADRQMLRMLSRLTPGDEVLELEGADLLDWLFASEARSADGILVPAGLEALPETDQGWALRRLFDAAGRFVFVAATPGDATARFVDRFERIARTHRGVHWELFVHEPTGRVRHVEGGRFLGRGTPRTWVIVDDRAGNETQAVGLAEALGWSYRTHRLHFGRLGNLHPRLRGASLLGLSRDQRAKLQAPWPDLVISAGRRAAPVGLWVRERAQGRTRVVHLGRKGGAAAGLFDLVVTPRHARLWPHPRRVETLLPLSRVSDGELGRAADRWKDTFEGDPVGPRIGVLVGGETPRYRLGAEEARGLAAHVLDLAKELGGRLWVTTSPRTGGPATHALERALGADAHFFPWRPAGPETPYLGLLAHCDLLVVTGESESMLAEACATDRPVLVAPLPGTGRGRGLGGRLVDRLLARAVAERPNDRGTVRPQQGLARHLARWIDAGLLRPTRNLEGLHAELVAAGRVQMLGEPPRLGPATPHREAGAVAARLRTLMGVEES